jgi:flagellar hook-basal body complex protein FliE
MAMEPLQGLSGIGSLGALGSLTPQHANTNAPAGAFATMLNGLLDGHREANAVANTAVTQLATGEAQDVHSVALAVAQADLSFRLILEMRNRLTEAYQEVMRMQV